MKILFPICVVVMNGFESHSYCHLLGDFDMRTSHMAASVMYWRTMVSKLWWILWEVNAHTICRKFFELQITWVLITIIVNRNPQEATCTVEELFVCVCVCVCAHVCERICCYFFSLSKKNNSKYKSAKHAHGACNKYSILQLHVVGSVLMPGMYMYFW